MFNVLLYENVNRKVPGTLESQTAASPRNQADLKRKRTKTYTRKTNKQMYEKHKDQILKETEKRGQRSREDFKHLAPRGINHKATQNEEERRDHRIRTSSSTDYRKYVIVRVYSTKWQHLVHVCFLYIFCNSDKKMVWPLYMLRTLLISVSWLCYVTREVTHKK